MPLWHCALTLQNFGIFLSSRFIYEPILLNISMYANIKKPQISHQIKCNLKGHWRSQKVLFMFKNTLHLFKILLRTQVLLHLTKKLSLSVFSSFRLYVLLYENLRKFFVTHSFMNRFWWKFIRILILWRRKYFTLISMTHSFMNWFWQKIYMKTIIINTKIFHFNKYDLKWLWRSQKVICLSRNLRKIFLTHSLLNRFW